MADIVQADYETLAAVAKRFVQQSNRIRQMHGQLNRQVALLRPAWIGKGAEAFFAEMADKVLPAVQRLSAALAEADRVTRQIEDLLRSAEEQGSAPLRSDTGSFAAGLPYGIDQNLAGGSDGDLGSTSGDGSTGGGSGGYGDSAGDTQDTASGESGGTLEYDERGDEVRGGTGGDFSGTWAGDIHRPVDLSDSSLDIRDADSGYGHAGDFSGTWAGDIYQPIDINNSLLDELDADYGFGDPGDLGDAADGLGNRGESGYAVPKDWLDGVGETSGGSSGGGAEASGRDGGGASGGGGDMGSGGTPSGNGEMGSGGAPMGSGSPTAGLGQAGFGGQPLGQGSGASISEQAAATALPGPLRYAAIGGTVKAAEAASLTPANVISNAASAPRVAQASVGVPMGLAALAPLLALVGKAIKDRSSER